MGDIRFFYFSFVRNIIIFINILKLDLINTVFGMSIIIIIIIITNYALKYKSQSTVIVG